MSRRRAIKSERGRTILEVLGFLALLVLLTFGGLQVFSTLYAETVAKNLTEDVVRRAVVRRHAVLSAKEKVKDIIDAVGPHGVPVHEENGVDGSLEETFWITLGTIDHKVGVRICERLAKKQENLRRSLKLIGFFVDGKSVSECSEDASEVKYLFSKEGDNTGSPVVKLENCDEMLCPAHATCTYDSISCVKGYKKVNVNTCNERCTECSKRELCPAGTDDSPTVCDQGQKPNADQTECVCCDVSDGEELCGCADPNGNCGCGCDKDEDCYGKLVCNLEKNRCECTEDSDCDGKICCGLTKKCSTKEECFYSKDCTRSEECEGNLMCCPSKKKCAAEEDCSDVKSCENDEDCDESLTCCEVTKKCVASKNCPVIKRCTTADDCGGNCECVNEYCSCQCSLCASDCTCSIGTNGVDCRCPPGRCGSDCQEGCVCMNEKDCICPAGMCGSNCSEDCNCINSQCVCPNSMCEPPECPEECTCLNGMCSCPCTNNEDCSGNMICDSDEKMCVCPEGTVWDNERKRCSCGENEYLSCEEYCSHNATCLADAIPNNEFLKCRKWGACMPCVEGSTAEAGANVCTCTQEGEVWSIQTNTCAMKCPYFDPKLLTSNNPGPNHKGLELTLIESARRRIKTEEENNVLDIFAGNWNGPGYDCTSNFRLKYGPIAAIPLIRREGVCRCPETVAEMKEALKVFEGTSTRMGELLEEGWEPALGGVLDDQSGYCGVCTSDCMCVEYGALCIANHCFCAPGTHWDDTDKRCVGDSDYDQFCGAPGIKAFGRDPCGPTYTGGPWCYPCPGGVAHSPRCVDEEYKTKICNNGTDAYCCCGEHGGKALLCGIQSSSCTDAVCCSPPAEGCEEGREWSQSKCMCAWPDDCEGGMIHDPETGECKCPEGQTSYEECSGTWVKENSIWRFIKTCTPACCDGVVTAHQSIGGAEMCCKANASPDRSVCCGEDSFVYCLDYDGDSCESYSCCPNGGRVEIGMYYGEKSGVCCVDGKYLDPSTGELDYSVLGTCGGCPAGGTRSLKEGADSDDYGNYYCCKDGLAWNDGSDIAEYDVVMPEYCGCPDGGKGVVEQEESFENGVHRYKTYACCKNGYKYVEARNFTTYNCYDRETYTWDAECRAAEYADALERSGYNEFNPGICGCPSGQTVIGTGADASCCDDAQVVEENGTKICCPADQVVETGGVRKCCTFEDGENTCCDGLKNMATNSNDARCCGENGQDREGNIDKFCCESAGGAVDKITNPTACCMYVRTNPNSSWDWSMEMRAVSGESNACGKCEDTSGGVCHCYEGNIETENYCCSGAYSSSEGITSECCSAAGGDLVNGYSCCSRDGYTDIDGWGNSECCEYRGGYYASTYDENGDYIDACCPQRNGEITGEFDNIACCKAAGGEYYGENGLGVCCDGYGDGADINGNLSKECCEWAMFIWRDDGKGNVACCGSQSFGKENSYDVTLGEFSRLCCEGEGYEWLGVGNHSGEEYSCVSPCPDGTERSGESTEYCCPLEGVEAYSSINESWGINPIFCPESCSHIQNGFVSSSGNNCCTPEGTEVHSGEVISDCCNEDFGTVIRSNDGIPVCCVQEGNGFFGPTTPSSSKACCFGDYTWDEANSRCIVGSSCADNSGNGVTAGGGISEECCYGAYAWDDQTCKAPLSYCSSHYYECNSTGCPGWCNCIASMCKNAEDPVSCYDEASGYSQAEFCDWNNHKCLVGTVWCGVANDCMNVKDYCGGHCNAVPQSVEWWCDCIKANCGTSVECYDTVREDERAERCDWNTDSHDCPTGYLWCYLSSTCQRTEEVCGGLCGPTLASIDVYCDCMRSGGLTGGPRCGGSWLSP